MAVSLGSAVLTIGGDAAGLRQTLTLAEGTTKAAMMQVGRAAQTFGYAITAMGGGITTALGLAVREAISFESAFAGVRKTMDGSEAEFAAIEKALREMSMTIPVSAQELTRIAELGGQLGVTKDAIIEFTKTVAYLDMSTDMTAESAAEMIAQFMNIMQLPSSEFDNIAAAIVDLGNHGASTEAQIAALALRLGGAGNAAGLSAPQVFGFASALANLGIEAEAGGTAFSKVFRMLKIAVDVGGQELDQFAQVAGMSAQQFAAAWQADPAAAIVAFVEGLGKIESAGGSLFVTLEQLDIKEARLGDTLMRVSGAGTMVADSIRLSSRAYAESTAHIVEGEKRASTLASQIDMLKHTFMELAREVGEALAPTLRGLLETVRPIVNAVIQWVQSNPELTQQIVKWTAAIGIAAAALGPLLFALPGVAIGVSAIGFVFAAAVSPVGALAAAIVAGLIAAFFALRPVLEEARAWVAANWDRIVEVFRSAGRILVLTAEILYQGLRIAWNLISALLVGVFRGIIDSFTHVSGRSKEYTDDFLGTVQWLFDGINDSLPMILNIVTSWADRIAGAWQTAVEWTRWFTYNIVGPIVETGKWFMWLAKIVWSSVGTVLKAIAQLGRMVGFDFNYDTGGGGEIPQFASGGTMRRPGLAYVHRDELMALPGGTRIYNKRDTQDLLRAGGGGVTINVSGVTINGVNDPEAIARDVSRSIERQIQNRLAQRGLRLSTA